MTFLVRMTLILLWVEMALVGTLTEEEEGEEGGGDFSYLGGEEEGGGGR